MKIKKKLSKKENDSVEVNTTEIELEQALEKVKSEIKENGLQSTQPKVKTEKTKMAKKSTPKTSTKNSPVEKEVKPSAAGYLAKDLAEEFEIVAADLRKALRAIKAEKPGKSWAWPKKTDAGLVAIRKDLKEYFKAEKSKDSKADKPKVKTKKVKEAAKEEEPVVEKKSKKTPAKKKKSDTK